jgi:ATPase family associated with various cellular activities (AAA)
MIASVDSYRRGGVRSTRHLLFHQWGSRVVGDIGIGGDMETRLKTIEVTGDVTIDWMLLSSRGLDDEALEFTQIWGSGISCRVVSQPGGAALQTRILKALLGEGKDKKEGNPVEIKVLGPSVSKAELASPGYKGFEKAFSSWSVFPKERGSKEIAWRISEFWGEDLAVPQAYVYESDEQKAAAPDLMVIDDSNQDFRENRELWPPALTGKKRPGATIIKMCSPLCSGALWEELKERHLELLTVVVSLSDLRKSGWHVGYSLSWEQIYTEILAAVRNSELRDAKRVIVMLGAAGAVIVRRDDPDCLVFDRYNQEGDWENEHSGLVVGHASCMVASIAWALINGAGEPEVIAAMKKGINASRELHLNGYKQYGCGSDLRLRFPYKVVRGAIKGEEADFAYECPFPDEGTLCSILDTKVQGNYSSKALDVALHGPEGTLPSVPIEKIGRWSSVDRGEIESMRSVQNILSEYVNQYKRGKRLERPLSIAVFGPPGSGKSFAIKEMAASLFPGELTRIEFNLSQLDGAEELDSALHEVRDLALAQKLPLVFWDEFDCPLEGSELGWLRYFLAPMQDGEFRQGGISHPIGPAIFVFAGGTCSTIEEFKEPKGAFEKHAKKKDFISRLKGFVNIVGPNPMNEDDQLFPLRRALLLRAILKGKARQLFKNGNLNIDEGVLNAFINIDEFLHGARSVEAIVDMSAITGKLRFERSSLPAENQLALHVNAEKFLRIVDSQETKVTQG